MDVVVAEILEKKMRFVFSSEVEKKNKPKTAVFPIDTNVLQTQW